MFFFPVDCGWDGNLVHLVVMETIQGLDQNHLNIIQEMKLELLQPHHVGSDAMKFPLLLSLHIDYIFFA